MGLFRLFCICLAAAFALPALAEPVRVAVVSDLNGSYGSQSYASRIPPAVAQIVELAPDLVISTGDMVAGQRRAPKLSADELAGMWRAFHRTVTEPLRAAGLPFAPTPGNHDASAYPGFGLERDQYAAEWRELPGIEIVDRGTFPFAYAFTVRDVLFISLDATTVGALPEDQMRWLDDLLTRSADRYRAEIVFSHLPLWPVAIHREREIIGDPALAALFRRHGVELHLSGHHHAYYPGAADGMLFVAQACLGGGPRRLIGTAKRSAQSFTMVEIADDGTIEVYALAEPDYRTRIDHASLPERIESEAATLIRMDLAR